MGDKVVIDWVVALIAALIGGGLSAFGAWLAVGRQLSAQDRRLDEIARTFFDFVIRENIRRIERLQTHRSANAGAISLFDLNMMIANYQAFERNREHIIRLPLSDRDSIYDLVSRIQVLANFMLAAEQERQAALSRLKVMENDPMRGVEVQKEATARANIDEAFSNLPGFLEQLKGLSTRLAGSKKGNKNG